MGLRACAGDGGTEWCERVTEVGEGSGGGERGDGGWGGIWGNETP